MPDAFDPYYLWLGIPPDEQPPNHYRLLTLKLFESNPDVIAGAADRQMAHVRSFQAGKHAADSQKLLNDLSAARLCLLSADKKARYDQAIKTKLAHAQAAAAPPPAPAGPPPAPAAAAPRPLRVARAAAPRPLPARASDNVLGFDPLAQSAPPRHRSRRSTAQQPTLLIGAGAALLAVIGMVWLVAGGGSDQPDKPPAKPIAAADRPTHSNDWDNSDSETSEPEARSKGGKPRRDDEPGRKQAASDESSDHFPDDLADAESPTREDDASGNTTDEMPVDDDPELSESSGASPDDAPAREAVPDAATVKTAVADIQKLFKDDFVSAKKPDQKAALAEKLLGLAADSSAPLERFALLSEAKRLAIGAGDLGLAMQAIDALAAQFELERFTLAADMAESLGNKELSVPARQELVEALAPLVDEAIAAGQIAAARRLATITLALARKGNQVDIAKVLVRQLHDMTAQEKLVEAAEAAREQLKSKPDDAEAHLTLGKYLCFVTGNWDEGLPHLQQGSDARLRGIAERELGAVEGAADRVKLGDQWWDLADEQKNSEKDRYRARAGYWYEQAAGKLTGLSKTKVEKRLEALANDTPAGTRGERRAGASHSLREPVSVGATFDRTRGKTVPLTDLPQQLLGGIALTNRISLKNVPAAFGVFLHPTRSSSGHASYELAGQFKGLSGRAGVNDSAMNASATPLTFRILGDTQQLWKSRPLQRAGDSEEFRVSVLGVRKLELLVDCPGSDDNAHAIWFEPQLTRGRTTANVGRPTVDGVKSTPANAKRFLSELTQQDRRAYSNGRPLPSVMVAGVLSAHGFFLHPNENTSSHVLYDIAGRYTGLTGKVGINDTADNITATALTFRVVGDGREVWRSRPLQKAGDSQEFHVDLRNVRQLELFVDCPGDNHGAHAVWIEPQLISRSLASGEPPSKTNNRVAIGKWIDLLPLIDPQKQTLRGKWVVTPDGLRGDTSEAPIQVPVTIAGSYELDVEFTRLAGSEVLGVILPTGATQTMLGISVAGGDVSGLFDIDNRTADANDSAFRPGAIENGVKHLLKVRVQSRGEEVGIESTLDGRPYVHWQGLANRLSTSPRWAPPEVHQPALGAWQSTVFHSVKLKLLSGTATIVANAIELPIASQPTKVASPAKDSSDLLKDAVLIATFDEPTILRKNGAVRVRDLSGKQQPGAIVGAEFVPGKAGKALRFQKTGDHVDFGDEASLNPPNFTFCAWTMPISYRNVLSDIFSKHTDDKGCSGLIVRFQGDRPKFGIGIGDGNWHYLEQETPVPLNQWAHLAVTHDNVSSAIYIDGRLARRANSDGPVIPSKVPCLIGLTPQHEELQFYGLIDELALFDRALSADEVQQIYQLGVKGKSLAPAGKK